MSQPHRVILHVFPSKSWGGAEIYSVQLAKAQKDEGEKVFYWATEGSQIHTEAKKAGIETITTPLNERVDLSLGKLLRVLKDTQATHVHLHWSGGMWSFGLAKYFKKFKLLL